MVVRRLRQMVIRDSVDTETIEVVVPAGSIGLVDVTVSLANGQHGVLRQAFRYLQPVQSNISAGSKIYDAELDPTGTYLIAATGSKGLSILNVDASTYTGDQENPLNPDALTEMIDRDGDDRDDRILAQVGLPDNYYALSVSGYFENGSDRVFAAAARYNGTRFTDAKLFVASFDPLDLQRRHIVGPRALAPDLLRLHI